MSIAKKNQQRDIFPPTILMFASSVILTIMARDKMKASTAIKLAQKQNQSRVSTSYYLPKEIKDWIENYAKQKGLSKSAIAEALLVDGIGQLKADEEKARSIQAQKKGAK